MASKSSLWLCFYGVQKFVVVMCISVWWLDRASLLRQQRVVAFPRGVLSLLRKARSLLTPREVLVDFHTFLFSLSLR